MFYHAIDWLIDWLIYCSTSPWHCWHCWNGHNPFSNQCWCTFSICSFVGAWKRLRNGRQIWTEVWNQLWRLAVKKHSVKQTDRFRVLSSGRTWPPKCIWHYNTNPRSDRVHWFFFFHFLFFIARQVNFHLTIIWLIFSFSFWCCCAAAALMLLFCVCCVWSLSNLSFPFCRQRKLWRFEPGKINK